MPLSIIFKQRACQKKYSNYSICLAKNFFSKADTNEELHQLLFIKSCFHKQFSVWWRKYGNFLNFISSSITYRYNKRFENGIFFHPQPTSAILLLSDACYPVERIFPFSEKKFRSCLFTEKRIGTFFFASSRKNENIFHRTLCILRLKNFDQTEKNRGLSLFFVSQAAITILAPLCFIRNRENVHIIFHTPTSKL